MYAVLGSKTYSKPVVYGGGNSILITDKEIFLEPNQNEKIVKENFIPYANYRPLANDYLPSVTFSKLYNRYAPLESNRFLN